MGTKAGAAKARAKKYAAMGRPAVEQAPMMPTALTEPPNESHRAVLAALGPCPPTVAGTTNYAHQAAGKLLEIVLADETLPFKDKLDYARGFIDSIGRTAVKAASDERLMQLEADLAALRNGGNHGTSKAGAERNPARALAIVPPRSP